MWVTTFSSIKNKAEQDVAILPNTLNPSHERSCPSIYPPEMSSFLASISHLLPAFLTGNGLKEYSRRYPSCFFLRLPLLIYLDYVFPCLAVEDIICLRRVNKAFYLITHEPSIWRRFLERMNHHPVIYLRPTFDYTNQDTYYEAEQIVTRTISLDDNWRASNPKVIQRILHTTYFEVLDMSLLPGGKYLVASTKDKSGLRYYIYLFTLDHPSGPRAVARYETSGRAFHLQTKYMKINDEFCIITSCVQRRHKNGSACNVNLSEFSPDHEIQGDDEFYSEVMVFVTSLPALEHICDPSIVLGSDEHKERCMAMKNQPLHLLNSWEVYEKTIQHMALFDNDGHPWIALVARDSYIMFFHCSEPDMTILRCPDLPNCRSQPIRGILPLPRQAQVLVVRQYTFVNSEECTIELYDFPTGHHIMAPTHYIIIRNPPPDGVVKVSISDPSEPYRTSKFPALLDEPLPPISVYLETRKPHGLVHYTLWPMYQDMPDGSRKCMPRYIVDPTPPPGGATPEWELATIEARKHYAAQTRHLSEPQIAHVLPGGYRAVYWTTSDLDRKASPSMLRLRRYLSPEIQKVVYPPRPSDNSLTFMRKERPLHPNGLYGTIEIPLGDMQAFNKGVNAITWEETTGRICVAVEGEPNIRILDMGMTVGPDSRFSEWKKQMSREIVEQDCWNSKDCIHSGSTPGWYEHWLN